MKNELWDPFEDIKKFRKEVDTLFKKFWDEKIILPKGLKIREPLVDIVDKKNEIEVTAELPGMEKKDVKVVVEGNKVQISAEKKVEKEEKKKNYFKQERSYKGFYKSFSLPAEVNPDKARLKFENGLLKLNLPKLKTVAKKKVLELK